MVHFSAFASLREHYWRKWKVIVYSALIGYSLLTYWEGDCVQTTSGVYMITFRFLPSSNRGWLCIILRLNEAIREAEDHSLIKQQQWKLLSNDVQKKAVIHLDNFLIQGQLEMSSHPQSSHCSSLKFRAL
jgi:hypothetical protein